MISPVVDNRLGRLATAVDILVRRLIVVAAGPELRVRLAISQAAEFLLQDSEEKQKAISLEAWPRSDRSGKW